MVTGPGLYLACEGLSGRCTHDVSRLPGRRLGALLSVDAHEVGQGGTAGEQRGRVAAKEGQQHLLKKQGGRQAFHAADGGVRQLQRGKQTPSVGRHTQRPLWDSAFGCRVQLSPQAPSAEPASRDSCPKPGGRR